MKIYFIACLCNWPKYLFSLGVPSLVAGCHFSDPYQSQIPWGTLVFSVGYCVMVWYSHSGNICPQLLDCKLDSSFHTRHCVRRPEANHTHIEPSKPSRAHHSPAGGKCYVHMQPGVYPSFVWVYQGSCFWFNCLISLSEVVVVVLGRGLGGGILRDYCSISKLLGLGWEGVMCGFAFNVLFTKVIVLFCIVV